MSFPRNFSLSSYSIFPCRVMGGLGQPHLKTQRIKVYTTSFHSSQLDMRCSWAACLLERRDTGNPLEVDRLGETPAPPSSTWMPAGRCFSDRVDRERERERERERKFYDRVNRLNRGRAGSCTLDGAGTFTNSLQISSTDVQPSSVAVTQYLSTNISIHL